MKSFKQRSPLQQIGGGAPAQAVPDVPPATPPVSPNNTATTQVQQNLKQQQLRRKSLSSTMMAGATGGWQQGTGADVGQAVGPSISSGPTKTG